MKRWTPTEEKILSEIYPQYGKKYCIQLLGKTEAQIRSRASILKLRQDRTSEFFRDWQTRAKLSKVGKKRPNQALVMKSLHKQGKLVRDKDAIKRQAETWKKKMAVQGHPRGMLGKKHTEETKIKFSQQRFGKKQNLSEEERQRRSDKMSVMMAKRLQEKGTIYSRSKTGWFIIGGKKMFLRSTWEVVYARSLEWMKQRGTIKDWEYEPTTFWFEKIKRGVRSYLPDFRVINNDGTEEYHEVKGYMDSKSITKISRMGKYYPEVKLVIIDKTAYASVYKWNRLYPEATKTVK